MFIHCIIFSRRLYWVEALSKVLYSSTLDGHDVTLVHSFAGSAVNSPVFGVTVHAGHAYVSVWYDGVIVKVNLGHMTSRVLTDTLTHSEIFSVASLSHDTQPYG